MIAVIFEFTPAEGRMEEYLGLVGALRDELARADGFVSIERFSSLTAPGKYVSVSFWRDEEAVRAWRNNARHREAQNKGRGGVFANYRLRVASVLRDYTLEGRGQAPRDSLAAPGERPEADRSPVARSRPGL